MGKILRGMRRALVIAVLALLFLFRFGLFGQGLQDGDGNDRENKETEAASEESPTITNEPKETTITIVVTQDQYLIDEEKVTLTQINEKVTDESAKVKVILENNYASVEAWDRIKTNLAKWNIIPIEQ